MRWMQGPFVALVAVVVSSHGAIAQHQIECVAVESVRVWTPIKPAVVKTRVEPTWPPYMNRLDVRGIVLAEVWIDEKGNVTCVKIVRSIEPFDNVIASAVNQWTFAPAMMGTKPVAVVQRVEVPLHRLR